MQQLKALQALFTNQSGRVIALGRVMLVTMFILALWVEPGRSADLTYGLLLAYAVGAVAIAVATWRNWWLDARLAIPAHAVDMGIFAAIVFSTNGSTSPFFLFFVLPLLSAAIRWGWRETAMTASALILLYVIAGLLLVGAQNFQLERFIIRSGHLVILSWLLIWFGIHQRVTRFLFHVDDFYAAATAGQNPLVGALRFTMDVGRAGGGALLIAPMGEQPCEGVCIGSGDPFTFSTKGPLVRTNAHSAFLFDVARDRAVTRLPQHSFHLSAASDLVDIPESSRLGATQGLAAEVRTGTQQGWLLLWDVSDLSTDFLDVAREIGRAAGAILDRHALLDAIEAGAAARTRLSLARDVHDSIVQFLAGAAFRVEAIKRAQKGGAGIGTDLDELKRLLVEEQAEIRGFLLALRRDREVELAEAVSELRALAERLSQQWAVNCSVSDDGRRGSIPIRLQLDLQQMLREAVANAVRHGGANRIDVGLAVEGDRLQIRLADNGSGFPRANGEAAAEPRSLKERVERAHGSIRLVSGPGSTNIYISLPLAGATA